MWRIPATLAVCGAATLGVSAPVASADAATQGSGGVACTPSIRALPLPYAMVNGDVLAVNGDRAAGFMADASGSQHVALWTRDGHDWRVRDLGDFGVTAP